jgi:hypothetical protein
MYAFDPRQTFLPWPYGSNSRLAFLLLVEAGGYQVARAMVAGRANPSAKVIPMPKSYTVTFRGSPTERLSPHALDEVKGLDNALTHALNLIRAGHQDVAIQDGTGKSVSGDLLMACCRGEKELTPDLFS